MVKNPPANAEAVRDVGLILGQEGPLEEEMATHSILLAWKIPWTEEPTVHRATKSRTRRSLQGNSRLN